MLAHADKFENFINVTFNPNATLPNFYEDLKAGLDTFAASQSVIFCGSYIDETEKGNYLITVYLLFSDVSLINFTFENYLSGGNLLTQKWNKFESFIQFKEILGELLHKTFTCSKGGMLYENPALIKVLNNLQPT